MSLHDRNFANILEQVLQVLEQVLEQVLQHILEQQVASMLSPATSEHTGHAASGSSEATVRPSCAGVSMLVCTRMKAAKDWVKE